MRPPLASWRKLPLPTPSRHSLFSLFPLTHSSLLLCSARTRLQAGSSRSHGWRPSPSSSSSQRRPHSSLRSAPFLVPPAARSHRPSPFSPTSLPSIFPVRAQEYGASHGALLPGLPCAGQPWPSSPLPPALHGRGSPSSPSSSQSAGSSPTAMDAQAGKRWNSRSLWFGWSSASLCAQPPQLGALAAGEQQLPIHGATAIFPFLPLGQPWRSASDPSSSHRSSRARPTSPRRRSPLPWRAAADAAEHSLHALRLGFLPVCVLLRLRR
jgi:hypothetical protein